MDKKTITENPTRKSKLTTGQVLGIANLGYGSIYNYVREFGGFFSPEVQKHTRGRKWGAADLELVLSIRALRHDNVPTAEIHKKLAAGWRIENNSAWHKHDRDNLVEAFVTMVGESNRLLREAERAVRDSKFASSISMDERHEIQKLVMRQKELEETIYKILKHFHMVRESDAKKPWWKILSPGEK
jgi:hypothetical protein